MNTIHQFLPHGFMHSVDYAVVLRYCIKTAKQMVKILLLRDSPGILVFSELNWFLIFRRGGSPSNEALINDSAKIGDFRQIGCCIAETVPNRHTVTAFDQYKIVCDAVIYRFTLNFSLSNLSQSNISMASVSYKLAVLTKWDYNFSWISYWDGIKEPLSTCI